MSEKITIEIGGRSPVEVTVIVDIEDDELYFVPDDILSKYRRILTE
jgi:hypothetical protein